MQVSGKDGITYKRSLEKDVNFIYALNPQESQYLLAPMNIN